MSVDVGVVSNVNHGYVGVPQLPKHPNPPLPSWNYGPKTEYGMVFWPQFQ